MLNAGCWMHNKVILLVSCLELQASCLKLVSLASLDAIVILV